jgi:hypothetical protein
MKLRSVYRLAIVLTKSQLRGSQRNKFIARLFDDPRIILIADAAIVLGLGLLGNYLLSLRSLAEFRQMIGPTVSNALVGVPTAIAFAVIVFGVLYEISQPVQSLSTDLVNWLPVSPSEYVAGSIVSESYIYSLLLSLFLGVLLGPALYFGMAAVWVATALMAVTSLFIGSCVVEFLDTLTNRISSSFYKKSGRSGIAFRLAVTIFVLVFVQLLFSGQIAAYVLQSIVRTVTVAWFVPVIWPSVAVVSTSQGNVLSSLVFASLSVGFFSALFGLAVEFRTRFWVPVPVSIKLTSRPYVPSLAGSRFPGMGAVESAIFRKDLRSLVRRREMARFVAIPFVLAVSMSLPFFSIGGVPAPEGSEFAALLPLYFLPVAIFCGLMAMTSIGQEGSAVWNLYAIPILPRQLLKAKLIMPASLGVVFSTAMVVVLNFILKSPPQLLESLIPLGAIIAFEQSALGLYFGFKFPDFRESVRARFVTIWGSLLGMGACTVVALLTTAPIMLTLFLFSNLANELTIAALAIGVVVFAVALKMAERQARILLQNIRV